MARTKTPAKAKAAPKETPTNQTPISPSKIPARLRFPLLVALNIAISAGLYTLVSPITRGDMATVSGFRDTWWEIGGLLVWRAVELAVGWWGGYDST